MIDGIQLTPLKKIEHPKGNILHGMKCSDASYTGFGEAYFSTVNTGDIKGWKKHTRMTLNLVVPQGDIRFVVFDDRPDSATNGQFWECTLGASHYQRLTVSPNLWMAFQGISPEMNMLLNIADIEHDPTEAINAELEKIKFNWE